MGWVFVWMPHWNRYKNWRKTISTMVISIFPPKKIFRTIFRPSQDPAIFCTRDFYSNSLISSVNLGKEWYKTSWKGRILDFMIGRMRWEGRGGERTGGGLKHYTKATSWYQNEGRGVILLYPFMTITKADLWKPGQSGQNIMVVLKDLVPMRFLSGRIHILFAQMH